MEPIFNRDVIDQVIDILTFSGKQMRATQLVHALSSRQIFIKREELNRILYNRHYRRNELEVTYATWLWRAIPKKNEPSSLSRRLAQRQSQSLLEDGETLSALTQNDLNKETFLNLSDDSKLIWLSPRGSKEVEFVALNVSPHFNSTTVRIKESGVEQDVNITRLRKKIVQSIQNKNVVTIDVAKKWKEQRSAVLDAVIPWKQRLELIKLQMFLAKTKKSA